jgi:hypothetical protein
MLIDNNVLARDLRHSRTSTSADAGSGQSASSLA